MKKINTVKIILSLMILVSFSNIDLLVAQSLKEINNTSAKWKSNPKIKLELKRTIGSMEEEDDNLMFYMPSEIVEDKDGNIYVVDTGNHRIQKFDKNFRYILTIGREGQGPAEFKRPHSMVILEDGNLFVSDQGNGRFQLLSPTGKSLETYNQPDIGVNEIVINSKNDILMGGGGFNMAGMRMMMGGKKIAQSNLIKRFNLDGKMIGDLVVPKDFKDIMMNRTANKFSFVVDKNDNVYVNYEKQNLIQKYSSDGKLLMNITRKLNFEADPPVGDSNSISDAGGGNIQIEMPDLNIASKGIAVDSKGRIWSVTYDRQTNEDEKIGMSIRAERGGAMNITVDGNTDNIETDAFKLEVFDTDGTLLQEIPLTHFAESIKIFGDNVYILDSLRGASFYHYKLSDN